MTEVAPGMVETEFSLVRFDGDAERAAGVYEGLEPLTAADVAEAIAFCVTRPGHVDVDYVWRSSRPSRRRRRSPTGRAIGSARERSTRRRELDRAAGRAGDQLADQRLVGAQHLGGGTALDDRAVVDHGDVVGKPCGRRSCCAW